MNAHERDELTMRHLEHAYNASHRGDSKAYNASNGESEVQDAILDAVSILARTSGITSTL